MRGNLTGSKRENLTDEEIFAKLPKKWKKADNLSIIKMRADFGREKINSAHCGLNDVWNMFFKVPECFLFDENISRIKDIYMGTHTFTYGAHEVQEDNMNRALKRMQSFAKAVYGDLDQYKNVAHVQNADSLTDASAKTKPNIADDKKEKKMENNQAKVVKNITPIVRASFKEDETEIESFCTNARFLHYLKDKKVNTLGDYMQYTSVQKNYWKVFSFGRSCKEVYNAFIAAILIYVNIKINEKGFLMKFPPKECENKSTKFPVVEEFKKFDNEDEMYAYFDTLSSTEFEKGSQSAKRISKMAAECFDSISNDLLTSGGCTEEEVEKYISDCGVKYRTYVDKRRNENEVKAAAARIRTKIDDIVDYKFNNAKQKQHEEGIKHSYNPFINDREL